MKKEMPAINPQELLTTQEAVKYLHRSETTIKRLRTTHELTCYTCGVRGRGNFYRREDLDKLFVPEKERLGAIVNNTTAQSPALAPER